MAVPAPSPTSTIAASAALPCISALVIVLRFITHLTNKTRPKVEDWLIIVALVLAFGIGATAITGVKLHALAYPTPPKGDPERERTVRLVNMLIWITQLQGILQLGLVKLSFLFWFRRIFKYSNSIVRKAIVGFIVIVTMWTVGYFLTLLFACRGNFAAWWNSGQRVGTKSSCLSNPVFSEGLAVSDFLLDVGIIVLPIPMVWNLQMPTSRKVLVCGIFVLGGLAVVSSIIRMAVFYEAKGRTKFYVQTQHPNPETNLSVTRIIFYTMIECNLSLVAASLPLLYSLFRHASLESIVRSVRSAISLRSLGSQGSHRSAQRTAQEQRNMSSESHEQIFPGDNSTETQVYKNEVDLQYREEVPAGNIAVRREVVQDSSRI